MLVTDTCAFFLTNRRSCLLLNSMIAKPDAFVADVCPAAAEHNLNHVLTFSAKGAADIFSFGIIRHIQVFSVLSFSNDLVDKTVFHGLGCGHEIVALGILLDYFKRLAVFSERIRLRFSLVRLMVGGNENFRSPAPWLRRG